MYPHICIDEENKKKLHTLCNFNKLCSDTITVQCNYDFSDILLENTPLPKVLVELICKWINDEIIFAIWNSYSTYEKYIRLQTESAYINYNSVKIEFLLMVKHAFFNDQLYNMIFCDNILKISRPIKLDEKQTKTKYMYNKTKTATENFKKIKNICITPDDKSFIIVNQDLWKMVCNVVYVLQHNIEKINM